MCVYVCLYVLQYTHGMVYRDVCARALGSLPRYFAIRVHARINLADVFARECSQSLIYVLTQQTYAHTHTHMLTQTHTSADEPKIACGM